MSVKVERYDPEERVRAKEASRAQDEADLKSGKVCAAELARINGGGGIARGAVVVDSPEKAERLLRDIEP